MPAALYSSIIFWAYASWLPKICAGVTVLPGAVLAPLSSGVNLAPRELISSILSLWLRTVAPVEYRSVRQFGVPPWNSCGVLALGFEASILPLRDLNWASV